MTHLWYKAKQGGRANSALFNFLSLDSSIKSFEQILRKLYCLSRDSGDCVIAVGQAGRRPRQRAIAVHNPRSDPPPVRAGSPRGAGDADPQSSVKQEGALAETRRKSPEQWTHDMFEEHDREEWVEREVRRKIWFDWLCASQCGFATKRWLGQ